MLVLYKQFDGLNKLIFQLSGQFFKYFYLISYRSELHNPTVTVRYGLLLESYGKANTEHMHVLYKQFDGLNKLNFQLSSQFFKYFSLISYRSELHNPTVTVRYGLLIESYLKANPEHMHVLYKQFDGLNKLNGLSQLMKAEKITTDKVRRKRFCRCD